MTKAISAVGTTLSRAGHIVAELTKIDPPAPKRDSIDVTNLASTGGYKEFIGGFIDAGELSIEGNFVSDDTDGQTALYSDFATDAEQDYVITFPSSISATLSFRGRVIEIKPADFSDANKQISFMAKVKVNSIPALAIGASAGLTTPFFEVSGAGTEIVPVAAGAPGEYIVNIATGIASVTITPTAAVGVITVNGAVVATGVASGAVALGAAGSVTEATITVTETGKVPATYNLLLARASA